MTCIWFCELVLLQQASGHFMGGDEDKIMYAWGDAVGDFRAGYNTAVYTFL